MSSKSFKDDLKDEMESDDLTESGSEFQTEQVFGYKYEFERAWGRGSGGSTGRCLESLCGYL